MEKLVDCRIIMEKDQGLFVIVAEIFWFCIHFPKLNGMDSIHHSVTPRVTETPIKVFNK
jgi:hypothetical protein